MCNICSELEATKTLTFPPRDGCGPRLKSSKNSELNILNGKHVFYCEDLCHERRNNRFSFSLPKVFNIVILITSAISAGDLTAVWGSCVETLTREG